MRVEQVDPRDEPRFAAWFAVLDAVMEHERPGEPHWLLPEQRELAISTASRRTILLAAVDQGRTVGAARLILPLRDNPTLGHLLVSVHPDRRRRGIGTALLAELRARARAEGRRILSVEIDEPHGLEAPSPAPCEPGAAADRTVAPGRAFALAVGATCGLLEARRDLVLPPDPARLAAVQAGCQPYASGYRIVTWQDRTPQTLLADKAVLMHRMSTDVPMGDMQWGEETWDVGRVREQEDLLVAQQRTWFTAAAERDGHLVGFTDLGVPVVEPARAYQWSTLVLREHRGHRLGTLMKIAAVRALVAASPASRLMTTWNAESNVPMIAVNEALGYRPAGSLSMWSLDVSVSGVPLGTGTALGGLSGS